MNCPAPVLRRPSLTRLFAPLALALTLGACASAGPSAGSSAQTPVDPAVAAEAAKQAELAIRQEALEYSRLQAIFWPITRAAQPLCPTNFTGSIGPVPNSLLGLRESLRPIVRRVLGTDERLTFTEVVEGTPAHLAGIQAGDILLSIDGTLLPTSKEANRLYFERLHAAAQSGATLALQLERKGATLSTQVAVERVCAMVALPIAVDAVSAHAAGRGVLVTRGMMRFANDRELAIVVAHEVAHIALGHTVRDKPAAAAPAGSSSFETSGCVQCGGGQANASAAAPEVSKLTQQARELDADAVGAYLAAAAGMPVFDAPNFWRRIAANYPAAIQSSILRTHPATPERFIELEKAVADVSRRLGANQSLSARLRSGSMTAALAKVTPAGPWNVRMLNDQYVSPVALIDSSSVSPLSDRQPSLSSR